MYLAAAQWALPVHQTTHVVIEFGYVVREFDIAFFCDIVSFRLKTVVAVELKHFVFLIVCYAVAKLYLCTFNL